MEGTKGQIQGELFEASPLIPMHSFLVRICRLPQGVEEEVIPNGEFQGSLQGGGAL